MQRSDRKFHPAYGMLLMLLFASVLLSGCGERRRIERTAILMYYLNADGSGTETQKYFPVNVTLRDVTSEVLDQLKADPQDTDMSSPLSGLTVRSRRIRGGTLQIDFGKEYEDLDPFRERLVREALVKTVTQVTGISGVSFTVEGDPLLDSRGFPVGVMSAEDFSR